MMITTKLPAAPYAEEVLARPRYMASPHLPMLNSAAVMAAPLHTLRHGIFTSGRNLNIAANSTVSTPKENTKSTTCPTQAGSESVRPIAALEAATTVDRIMEIKIGRAH